MSMRLARYDREIAARLDLDQAGIERAASRLLAAIEEAVRADPSERNRLAPLVDYAMQGLTGKILAPRNWRVDPLYVEFRERLLPKQVNDAYAAYSVYTHGKLRNPPVFREIDGVTYVEVDDG